MLKQNAIYIGLGVIVLLIVVGVGTVFFKEKPSIAWNDYTPALFENAKKTRQTVVIFAEEEGCLWCLKMKTTTLVDPVVVKLINENFIPVMLPVDQQPEVADKYKVEDLPTIIFFDADGNMRMTLLGYMPSDMLIANINKVLTDIRGSKK